MDIKKNSNYEPNHFKRLNLTTRFAYFFFLFPLFTSAQVSQDFEGMAGVDLFNSTCWYFDFDFTTTHIIQNYATPCGTIVVQSPGSGATLGFDITWNPNGNGTSGLSDGDAFGVAIGSSVLAELSAGPPSGAQAFLMEDTDGAVSMKFDEVDLTGTTNPMLSLQYYLPTDGGYEVADFVNIYVVLSDCGAATTVTLLNSTGSDIDGLGITGSWNTLSANLTPYIGCTAQLFIAFSSNSASEELGIDNIKFTAGTLLPIELKDFYVTALENTVELNWTTLTELNNEGFEIQHSVHGKEWEPLTFVKGNGTSIAENRYSYQHSNPNSGLNYYRLKQIDFDGTFEYSPIKAVAFQDDIEILLSPNPAHEFITIDLRKSPVPYFKIQVYNSSGHLVKSISSMNNKALCRIQITDLPSGTYFLTAFPERGKSISLPFVK